jgi:hypothetical protein
MDSLLLQAVATISRATSPTASAAVACNFQGSPLLASTASVLVPALPRRNSLSLRKSASETFKDR